MTDVRAAFDPNRLPWLSDTRAPVRKNEWHPVLLWSVLAGLLIAGVAYWAGMESSHFDDFARTVERSSPAATVALPQPEPAPSAADVRPPMMRDVEPFAPRELVIAEPAPVAPSTAVRPETGAVETKESGAAPSSSATEGVSDESEAATSSQVAAAEPAQVQTPAPLQLWPADVSEGAHGRVARIGTFSSRVQAKRAWWRIVRVYPGIRRLNATVVSAQSLRNGRTYYRLQFGTTSQAHSTVLCQRMRIVGQSCVVVGAPGRA